MTYDSKEKISSNIQKVKNMILERIIAKPIQSKHEGNNTIGFIGEVIAYYAWKDAMKEFDLEQEIIYNSQFNGQSPRKGANNEGPDVIVPALGIGVESKVRNNPKGHPTEKEFSNEVVLKFNGKYSNKLLILYTGYTKEKIEEVYILANKNGIYTIVIPYPIPYTKIDNLYCFELQKIEEYIEKVYLILLGKLKYYLKKIISSLKLYEKMTSHPTLTTSYYNNDDHGMVCSFPFSTIINTSIFFPTIPNVLTKHTLNSFVMCFNGLFLLSSLYPKVFDVIGRNELFTMGFSAASLFMETSSPSFHSTRFSFMDFFHSSPSSYGNEMNVTVSTIFSSSLPSHASKLSSFVASFSSNAQIIKCIPTENEHHFEKVSNSTLIAPPTKGVSEMVKGEYFLDREVMIANLIERVYKGCNVCGKAYNDKSEGDVIECNSKRCRGEKRKVEKIHFIKAFAENERDAIIINFQYFQLKKAPVKGGDVILLSGRVEGEDYFEEPNKKFPVVYPLRYEKKFNIIQEVENEHAMRQSSNAIEKANVSNSLQSGEKLFKCKTCGCGPWRNQKYAREHIQLCRGHEIEEISGFVDESSQTYLGETDVR